VLATSSVPIAANGTATGKNCSSGTNITITVNLTDGTNPITGAGVDVRDSNGRGNFTKDSTTSGANAVYTVSVPAGTYTVRSGHPNFGPIGSTANVSTTQTITHTATAGTTYAVTGTVTGDGTAMADAWVALRGTPTGQSNFINVGAKSGSDGTFSISVPAGSYTMRADKPGYKSPAESAVTVTAAKAVGTVALTTATRTITGTVTLSGSGVSGAFVSASDTSGSFAVAQTDAAGAYSLAVENGTWTVHARSMGYESSDTTVTVAGNSPSGQTLALSAMSGFTVKPEKQENVTPSQGGFLTNSDIGNSFKLNIPANALGTGSNAGTVKTQANTAVPNPPSGTVLSKNAVSISAVDNSGSPIKNLNDEITIVIPYTEGDLPSGITEDTLVIGVWNDATNQYDTLSTTVDSTNNTLTASASHLSDFAPIVPSTATPAAAATTPTTTNTSGGGGGIAGASYARIGTMMPTIPVVSNADSNSGIIKRGGTTLGSIVVSYFTKAIKFGARSSEIKELQMLLNRDPATRVAVTGPGSAGNETDKLGPATLAAIKKFQVKHGIARPGVIGYGLLGPKTRAKLNELRQSQTGETDQVADLLSAEEKPKIVVSSKARLEMINALLAKIKELQAELAKMQATGL